MTTHSGEGGKQAASPNDTHLISNNDPYGHSEMWCGAEFVPSTESIAETTCLLCLKAAKIYGEGATQRVLHLEASKAKQLSKARKRHIDRDSGADGHNGVWGT